MIRILRLRQARKYIKNESDVVQIEITVDFSIAVRMLLQWGWTYRSKIDNRIFLPSEFRTEV